MYRASMFDIPRKPEHLKSGNEGTASAHYRQVTATRDVSGSSFYRGVQQFRFETSGNTWFVPSMSYFRLRCSLHTVRVDGGELHPILDETDIAPTMGLAANLFKSVEVRLNGHTVERITERLPQIDALKTRMRNTGSWLDQVGQATNFWDPDASKRQQQVSVQGYLGTPSNNDHERGPWLTQTQAQFHAEHRLRYERDTQLITFDANGHEAIDVQYGVMALRIGDRLCHGALVYEVVRTVDATHALVTCVNADAEGNRNVDQKDPDAPDVDIGVADWYIQKLSSASNNEATGQSHFEIIWRPPLGFFDVEHAIPPGGEWVIEFNPANKTDALYNVVESFTDDLAAAASGADVPAGSFRFAVNEFFFCAYTIESDRFDHGDWFLDLQNTRCQLQNMPTNSTSLISKNFDVPGKTAALTLAFQDQGPTSDTRFSQSKFKIRPAPVTDQNAAMSTEDGQDLLLERFFIQYGNEQKPVPDFDGSYSKALADSTQDSRNHLLHRYVDSLMQANLFHTDGGAESFADWIRRGPFYHFRWPKDAMENSTRVTVNFKFRQPFADNMEHQVMLFSQWRTAYKISHRNGRVEIPTLQEL